METNDKIYASSLKGFCSVGVCWQMLHDLSSQLSEWHGRDIAHGHVDLKHIMVQGRNFILEEEKSATTTYPEQDIWNLAAAAFELMMGSPVFNGAGEGAQQKSTPIPSLPQPEAEELNKLITKCLNYQQKERPTAREIMDIASDNLKTLSQKEREPRTYILINSTESLAKTDRQWPEKMLSSLARNLVVFLLLMLTLPAFSQVSMDKQAETVTQKLLDAALLLRNGDVNDWNTAQDELEKRLSQFTLMNELQDRSNDCPLISSQVKTFGVNRIVMALKKGQRVQMSGQELLDGADVRFSYSLFEKAIKKGCTSTYSLSGRYGKQVFLVVPHSSRQAYTTELILENGSTITPAGKDADGVTYYLIDTAEGPKQGENIHLKITNKDSDNNASFVIINHNYRDKK